MSRYHTLFKINSESDSACICIRRVWSLNEAGSFGLSLYSFYNSINLNF